MAEQLADIHHEVKLFFGGNGRTDGRYPQRGKIILWWEWQNSWQISITR